ncbi:CRISPR-associated endonuclease Cas1, partial [Thermococci archaeon]
MRILVDDYGVFVGKKNKCFVIRLKGEEKEISSEKVEQIIISKASSISSGAVELAVENNIDIVFLSPIGRPIARVYPCKMGGTTKTRRKQLEASMSETGKKVAQRLIHAKLMNQSNFIRSLAKNRTEKQVLDEVFIFLRKKAEELMKLEPYETKKFFSIEGLCGKKYFEAL